jgi:hypothetical protein
MCKSQEESDVKKALLAVAVSIALAGGIQAGNNQDDDHNSSHFDFKPGTLIPAEDPACRKLMRHVK